ncbi:MULTISPECIES: DUF4082 domain-containing protein [unclassified Saccharothrix]|uniref:DUF4082 domain-containing protein n=1 Tax=unclassified Saccharothrix TaxID=2593673 RepID=UPI00307D1D62
MALSGAARRGTAWLPVLLVLAALLTPWSPPAVAQPGAFSVEFTDVPGAVVGTRYSFGGTAADAVSVEVSTDGGARWLSAALEAGAWRHAFTPTASGPAELRVRAYDQGGAVATASATVDVAPRVCPCGLWTDEDRPRVEDLSDGAALELGVRWRAASDGYVRGVRFYKGPGNTGTHTGSLWTASGELLATGTFRDETAAGWQTLLFAQPVAVAGNTTHVVSYLSPTGHFSADTGYFTDSARHLEPLTGLRSGVEGVNGVFRSGKGFPSQGSQNANYWVDVLWAPEPGADTRAPEPAATDPSAGTGSVPLTGAITATYDEVVDPASATLAVTGPNGDVPGTTSVTGTIVRFTPTSALSPATTYTATARARDASGNQSSPHNWVFTTGSPRASACPCSVWDDFARPAEAAALDTAPVELGTKVRFAGRGEVLGVRFYKGPGNTGTHTGSLWSSDGLLLASGTFTDETTTGWQTLTFLHPVSVQANTTYVVSYFAPRGRYSVSPDFFAAEAGYGPVRALSSGTDGPNGVYRYGGGFPAETYNRANYWVDVIYRNGLNGDTTAPTLESRTPVAEAVPLSGAVSLTYSELMDPASPRVWLTDPAGATLHGTTRLSDDQKTVTWQPTAPLAPGTRYTVTAIAADLNGNASSPATWPLTTDQTPACPCSLFSGATVPTTTSAADSGSYELGVRFKVAYNGHVTGVRFYKGAGNTGTHTGTLWTTTGAPLATGTFTNETATGWQTLLFDTPVPVRAGNTYVASYTAPNGHYAVNHNYFQSLDVTSPPLTAPRNAWDTPNGVYAAGGGFPTTVHQGNNYWVDVTYTFSGDQIPPVGQGHTPLPDAQEVDLNTPLTATYDEPIDLTATTFVVQDSGGAPITGTLTRTPDGHTATWTPAAPLSPNTRHTVRVRATDETGSPAPELAWAFSTTTTQTCPCTLFSAAATPAQLWNPYTQIHNVGVQFTPTTDGTITAIRFYKGSIDDGPHTASLWTAGGELVAAETVDSTAGPGWQTVTLATPVPVTAGTTYVAGRTVPSGHPPITESYFTGNPLTRTPLTTPAGTSNGLLGGSDMPTQVSTTGVNYWVDVVFTTP